MSDTPTPPTPPQEEIPNAMAHGDTIEKEIKGKWMFRGKEITVVKFKHYRVTRLLKDKAREYAMIQMKKEYDRNGILPSAFEEFLAKRIIKSWSLEPQPTAMGWEWLEDEDLGDKICDESGISAALASVQAKLSKPEEKAKNE